jgi:radical SAM superfamily enzyme YgiQ (UPF0313 family)
MRILLLKPYQPVHGWLAAPPLGLLYLVSNLRRRFGHEVEIDVIDMKSQKLPPEWLAERLDRLAPDIVGVSALNQEAAAARRIAEIVKGWNDKTVTVLGGPYALKRAEELLAETAFDWVFDGPADRTFPEAVARRFGGEEIGTDIPGLSHKSEDGVHLAGNQDVITELDDLPHPAWDLVDFDHYARLPNMMMTLKGRRYATIFTSRGCPYLCNYCHDLFTKRFVHRSPENVIEEIEILFEKYGVDEIQIVDDIFNLHKPRVKAIMGEIARRWPGRIHITFPNGLRGDILDESVLDAMQAAGTYAMSIAIETVTPRLQDLVEKHLKIDRAERAIELADERGMMVAGFFMLGFPSETREELDATVEFAMRSRLTTAYFFCVVPQPKTPLWETAAREAPEAVLLASRDEEEGENYRSASTWYERAYGFPLNRYIERTYRRFYLRPRRLLRVLRRVPPRSWWLGSQRLLRTVAFRDAP